MRSENTCHMFVFFLENSTTSTSTSHRPDLTSIQRPFLKKFSRTSHQTFSQNICATPYWSHLKRSNQHIPETHFCQNTLSVEDVRSVSCPHPSRNPHPDSKPSQAKPSQNESNRYSVTSSLCLPFPLSLAHCARPKRQACRLLPGKARALAEPPQWCFSP